MANDKKSIEVVYARHQPIIRKAQVNYPCTLRQAIEQSGILKEFVEINLSVNRVGVFGKLKSLDATINMGDRIEIYCPLLIDPKEKRRQLASKKNKKTNQKS